MKNKILLVLVCALLLAGCASPERTFNWGDRTLPGEPYEIYEKDGEYYLKFVNEKMNPHPQQMEIYGLDLFCFASVSQLQDALLNQTLTYDQTLRFVDWFEGDENGYYFFDPATMYDPALPLGCEVDSVHLLGASYRISFTGLREGSYTVYTQRLFEELFAQEWGDGKDVEGEKERVHFYTLETKYADLFVKEVYLAKEEGDGYESTPKTTVYAKGKNGAYFLVDFSFQPKTELTFWLTFLFNQASNSYRA